MVAGQLHSVLVKTAALGLAPNRCDYMSSIV